MSAVDWLEAGGNYVRLDCVKGLRTVQPGEYRLALTDGRELPLSQRYRDRLPRG